MLLPNQPDKSHRESELSRVKREGSRSAEYAEYVRRCIKDQQHEADAQAAAVNRRVKGHQLRRSA